MGPGDYALLGSVISGLATLIVGGFVLFGKRGEAAQKSEEDVTSQEQAMRAELRADLLATRQERDALRASLKEAQDDSGKKDVIISELRKQTDLLTTAQVQQSKERVREQAKIELLEERVKALEDVVDNYRLFGTPDGPRKRGRGADPQAGV